MVGILARLEVCNRCQMKGEGTVTLMALSVFYASKLSIIELHLSEDISRRESRLQERQQDSRVPWIYDTNREGSRARKGYAQEMAPTGSQKG